MRRVKRNKEKNERKGGMKKRGKKIDHGVASENKKWVNE